MISATEFVYTNLRERIISGELLPGAKLIIEKIASELGVSRTPVREALQKLQAEGLVVVAPRKYTMVSEISFKDLDKLYEVRRVLEELACHHIMQNWSEADMERLELLLEAAHRLMADNDLRGLRRVNTEFHKTLYHATGNPYLEEVLLSLREKSWRYIEPAIRAKKEARLGLISHKEIVEALKERDLAKLQGAVAKDLLSTIDMIHLAGHYADTADQ